MTYVIVSECERGFWSNQFGWVHDKASASVFPKADEYPIPLRARHEGSFLEIERAPEFYLEEPLVSGDEVIWDDPDHAFEAPAMRVDEVKTADGCARTSEDIIVLRNPAGLTVETSARAIVSTTSTITAFAA